MCKRTVMRWWCWSWWGIELTGSCTYKKLLLNVLFISISIICSVLTGVNPSSWDGSIIFLVITLRWTFWKSTSLFSTFPYTKVINFILFNGFLYAFGCSTIGTNNILINTTSKKLNTKLLTWLWYLLNFCNILHWWNVQPSVGMTQFAAAFSISIYL